LRSSFEELEGKLELLELGLVGLVDLSPAVSVAALEAWVAVVRDIAVEIAAAALDPGALLGDLALEECAARLGALPARFVPGPGMVLGRADRALELLERLWIVVLQEMPDCRR
jgi:hypothetical protein